MCPAMPTNAPNEAQTVRTAPRRHALAARAQGGSAGEAWKKLDMKLILCTFNFSTSESFIEVN